MWVLFEVATYFHCVLPVSRFVLIGCLVIDKPTGYKGQGARGEQHGPLQLYLRVHLVHEKTPDMGRCVCFYDQYSTGGSSCSVTSTLTIKNNTQSL